MAFTIGTTTYAIDAPSANAVIYRHPDSSLTHKRQLKLGRTDAKPTPTNPGVTRTEAKVTSYVNAGERIDPVIFRAETSVPVTAAAADVAAALAEFRAFVASTSFDGLVTSGAIYHA